MSRSGPPRSRASRPVSRVRALSALLFALFLVGCGGGGTDDGGTSPTEGEQTQDGAEPATGTEVAIESFAFSPATLTIAVGDTVTWTNNDSAAHTATADDDSFDSGSLNRGDSFSHTFDEAGTYAYICTFHPNMTGEIVVE